MIWAVALYGLLLALVLETSPTNAMQCGYNTNNLKGTITGPLSRGSYQQYSFECVWTISAPQGHRIILQATSFNLPISQGRCTKDWIRIESITENNRAVSHGDFCGTSLPSKIISKRNQLKIRYSYSGDYYRRDNSYFSFNHNAERYVTTYDLTRQWINNNTQIFLDQKENLPRSISALFLFNETFFVQGNATATNLMTQYRLQLAANLVKNITQPLTASDLSHHVTALLALCSNPRSFYGIDLVKHLRKEMNKKKGLVNPYFLLTLCNAEERITPHEVKMLKSIIEIHKADMFWLDFQAMALMTLVCVKKQNYTHITENEIPRATSALKKHQLKDGSFGSLQTTSLVIQALTVAESIEIGWNKTSAIEFVEMANNTNGSFGNLYNLYAAIPIINKKTMLDINASRCDFPTEGLTPLEEIREKMAEPIDVLYSLWIGDKVDFTYTITMKVPNGTKFLDFMRLAAKMDEKFQFRWKYVKDVPYVYQIYGLVNDPSSGKYWVLLTGADLTNLKPHPKGLENYVPKDGDIAVMWYKTVALDHQWTEIGGNYTNMTKL